MASKACVNRLQKEYKSLLKDPVPNIKAHPSPSNLLEWHYVLEGSANSDYESGVYHGKVIFSQQYPYKPPSIIMLTPSGRFAVQQKLCLSMSDFHPESWNPMWSVGTILNGLLSFMNEVAHTTGSIATSKAEKRRLAKLSLEFNLRNPMFRKLFSEYIAEQKRRLEAEQELASRNMAMGQTGDASEAAPSNPNNGWSLLASASLACILLAILLLPFLSQSNPNHNSHLVT
ncbi:UBC-like protein [Coccomyxa subellipsoidea C-169]|uniref:E2 ubiquitin-conjugating enzyme n=1 Tax=Coccomyxa subellipsoidea (strain C-169) TaxID=574566 RepID=I0YVM1_COCSC|nr:UBC-like protein [Coccomyxa subellipsoidea C-169]EIE22440.1 UBC-like protein [Coccomyxa subellipsoidea C-169]|eukprot:XP_005646984.1 UBC-like protein [Coccomyxa subellipsoidea C-169]